MHHYAFTEEDKCALIDMVRYNDATVVASVYRNELMLRLAKAAVTTLYGEQPLPDIQDIEHFPPSEGPDPSDNTLAVMFMLLPHLPKS